MRVFVPARREEILSFSLKSLGNDSESLPVNIVDAKGGNLKAFSLPQDGNWNEFKMLRPALERVRPQQLLIKLPAGKKATLTSLRFTSAL